MLDEILPTVEGWKKFSDLQIGDTVFDEAGEECTINFISEIYFPKNMYEIKFCDNSTLTLPSEFLLTVWTESLKKSYRRYMTLEENKESYLPENWAKFEINTLNNKYLTFKERLKIKELCAGGVQIRPISRILRRRRTTIKKYSEEPILEYDVNTFKLKDLKTMLDEKCRIYIPLTLPLKYKQKLLPIDPWVFGYQLGDANTGTGSRIACHRDDKQSLIGLFEKRGMSVSHYPKDEGHFGLLNMTPIWKSMNLHNGKFIPDCYLRSSVEQRIDCVAGLLESDGCITKDSAYIFVNVNENIVYGLSELLSSLGIIHSITCQDGKDSERYAKKTRMLWRVYFKSNLISCYLQRKKNLGAKLTWRHLTREVVSIKEAKVKESIKVVVDSKSGLFLMSRNHIPVRSSII